MRLLVHAGVTLALLAAAIGVYYSFGQYMSDDVTARYAAVAALAAAVMFCERISRRNLLLPQPASTPATETWLRASLRKDWFFLIPPALFGPCLHLANQYAFSWKALGAIFFACLGSGLWPVYSRRAPPEFWAIAIVIWFVSFALSEVVPRFIK